MNEAMHMPAWAFMQDERPHRSGGRGRGHRRGGGSGRRGSRNPDGDGNFGPPGRGRGRGRGRVRRGEVRLALLALLAEEPRNGYQLIQEIEARTEGAWKPSPGAVYPALSQLEDEGLIVSADGSKTFTVTAQGRTAAADIDPKPWESVNREMADAYPDDVAELSAEFRRLADAVQAISNSGNEAERARAGELLAETRRRLFGLLAADS